jgi:hypothetical protein
MESTNTNQNDNINLEQMIISLLTGININEINQYILQFIETPECWTASTSLFSSLNEDVRYFSANIVYTKVRILINFLYFSKFIILNKINLGS